LTHSERNGFFIALFPQQLQIVLSSKEEDIHTNGQITLTDVARKLIFFNSTIYTIHDVDHLINELIELNCIISFKIEDTSNLGFDSLARSGDI